MDIERLNVTIQIIIKNIFDQIRLFLNKNKHLTSTFVLLATLSAIGWWLLNKQRTLVITGEIAGHHYSITYAARRGKNYQPAIDSIFTTVIETLDSQLPNSAVTQLNDPTNDSLALASPYLYDIITRTKLIYQQTHQAFDPTVEPLVKLWRQSLSQGMVPQIEDIQRIQQSVGLDYIVANEKRVKKLKEGVQINLDMLLASYAVDVLASFLQEQRIKQYCIKIDNSVYSAGYGATKGPKLPYIVSFNSDSSSALTCYNQIANRASVIMPIIYNQDGIPSPLVIDPQSGWVAAEKPQTIIVFANNCTAAHAYAIALQVLGWDQVLTILDTLQDVMACRIRMHNGEVVFDTLGNIEVRHQPSTNQAYLLCKEEKLSPSPRETK